MPVWVTGVKRKAKDVNRSLEIFETHGFSGVQV